MAVSFSSSAFAAAAISSLSSSAFAFAFAFSVRATIAADCALTSRTSVSAPKRSSISEATSLPSSYCLRSSRTVALDARIERHREWSRLAPLAYRESDFESARNDSEAGGSAPVNDALRKLGTLLAKIPIESVQALFDRYSFDVRFTEESVALGLGLVSRFTMVGPHRVAVRVENVERDLAFRNVLQVIVDRRGPEACSPERGTGGVEPVVRARDFITRFDEAA